MKAKTLAILPEDFVDYKRGDAIRIRGNLIQAVIVWVSRGGWVHIEPMLYVVGADLANDTLRQSVSLGGKDPRRWHFPPDTPLDEMLSREILDRLESDSPISFTDPLEDEAIDKALRWFGRDKNHWSAELFLAFFNMTRGAHSARADLARAFELFRRHSRLSTDKPLRDWEEVLRDRFIELEARLDNPDCIALCRADSEAHVKLLGLPPILWPPEWPERVPPWPKETNLSWVHKLGKIFRG